MTIEHVYRYPGRHFDFHTRQLLAHRVAVARRRSMFHRMFAWHLIRYIQYRRMSKSQLPLTDVIACAYAPLARQPLSINAAADVAAKLKALSDPVRLRLFSLVASHVGGEACVCDVSGGFDVSQPTISITSKCCGTPGC